MTDLKMCSTLLFLLSLVAAAHSFGLDLGLELSAPTFSQQPDPITIAVVGSDVKLKCESSAAVTWYFVDGSNEDEILTGDRYDIREYQQESTTVSRLKINDVTLDDTGRTILCRASFNFGTASDVSTTLDIKVPCSEPVAPEHGGVETPNGPYTGETVFYSCDPGYSLVGESESLCQEDQTWQHVGPVCTDLEVIMNQKFSEMRESFDATINELQETISTQASLISTLESNHNLQQEEIDAFQSDVTTLQSDRTSQQQSIETITTQLTNYDQLSATVNSMPETYATISSVNHLIAEEFASLDSVSSSFVTDLTDALDNRILSLETECTTCSAALESANSAVGSLEGMNEQLMTLQGDTNTAIADLRNRVTANELATTSLNTDVTTVTTQVATANEQIVQLDNTQSTQQSSLTSLTTDVSTNQQNLASLTATVSQMNIDFAPRITALESVQHTEDINEIRQELEELSQVDLDGRFQNITSHFLAVTENLQYTVSLNVSRIETELTTYAPLSELSTLRSDLTNVENGLNEVSQELDSVSTNYATISQFDNVMQDVSDIQTTVNSLPQSYATTDIVDDVAASISSLEESFSSVSTVVDSIPSTYATIASVDQVSTQVSALENDVSSIHTTLNDLPQTYATSNSVDDLSNRVTTLENAAESGDSASASSLVTELTDDLNVRISSLETECTSCSTAQEIANAATESIASLNDQLIANQADTGAMIVDLETRVTINEGEIANLHTDVNAVNGEVTVASQQIDTLANTQSTLQSSITSLTAEVNSNQLGLATVTASVDNMNIDFSPRITALESVQHSEDINEIRQELEELSQMDLDGRFQNITSHFLAVTNNLQYSVVLNVSRLETELTAYAPLSEVGALRNDFTAVQNELEELSTTSATIENVENLATRVTALETESSTASEISALQDRINSLESDGSSSAAITSLESSVAQLEQRILTNEASISSSSDQTTEIASNVDTLNTLYSQVDVRLTSTNDTLSYYEHLINYLWVLQITGNIGQISSPYHPYSYPIEYYREWTVTVDEGFGIEFIFVDMQIEYHEQCSYDNLAFYNGPSTANTLLGTFCSESTPTETVRSDSSTVLIVFQSDYQGAHRGFLLVYQPIYAERVDLCYNEDACSNGECSNSAYDDETWYTCACDTGYAGTTCDHNFDDCIDIDCGHGYCVDGVNTYDCSCNYGYEGNHCENDVNECETASFCVNGECTNLVGSYDCSCYDGWTGQYCDADINECASNPCLQGYCNNNQNSYSCSCYHGWVGVTCDYREPLDLTSCYISGAYDGSYASCAAGYYSTSACASGDYANCYYNGIYYTTLMECCPLYDTFGNFYSFTNNYDHNYHLLAYAGHYTYCATNEVMTSLCGSSSYRSCYVGSEERNSHYVWAMNFYWDWYQYWYTYTYHQYVTNIMFCFDVPTNSGRYLSGDCYWMYADFWNPTQYCPDQYVIAGFCGSDDGTDCFNHYTGGHTTHGIYCCPII